ncbi:FAD:protein FMN transferase [Cryptosporangium sp. NPDC051539]|uniref:FAD:protein FMN transferase n=1 Tax=Cryptosporangium sp. NPDC051539 TaxID=3363962 RepID=UPI0037BCEA4D
MTDRPEPGRRVWVEQIMGLPVSIHVRGPAVDSDRVNDRVDAVFASLRAVDRLLSPYRDDSALTRWERGELALGDAGPALPEVIELCEEARQRTDGWFNARDLPDPRGGRPRFDPSGLVKGWSVERAARHLDPLDDHDWHVNAGGDIVVSTAGTGRPWRVGVEDPSDARRLTQVVEVRDGAIATSANTHRGGHIVDPFSGLPSPFRGSVTVVGPSLLWADVYATAGVARGSAAPDWCGDLEGYEAMILEPGGSIRVSKGWLDPGAVFPTRQAYT